MATETRKYFLVLLLVLVLLAIGIFLVWEGKKSRKGEVIPREATNSNINTNQNSNMSIAAVNDLSFPIGEFKERITKKPFGIYVVPEDSPVQPERFRGYHTGCDVEYEDVPTDVPVLAVADGSVVYSNTVSGYGGVFLISIELKGESHTILYGHIRPGSLPKLGTLVKKGQKLAVLGTGYSSETSGERKHLHFGVLSNDRIDLLGYVQKKEELSVWVNPVSLY